MTRGQKLRAAATDNSALLVTVAAGGQLLNLCPVRSRSCRRRPTGSGGAKWIATLLVLRDAQALKSHSFSHVENRNARQEQDLSLV